MPFIRQSIIKKFYFGGFKNYIDDVKIKTGGGCKEPCNKCEVFTKFVL